MKATKHQPGSEQGIRFLGGVTIQSGVAKFFESLSIGDQKLMAMYGSLPQKMGLALAISDHRAKSLLGRDGNDGLVYACLRFNPTIEFEVEEQLQLKRLPMEFAGKEVGRGGKISGIIRGDGIVAGYSAKSDATGRRFLLDISIRANGKPFAVPTRAGSIEHAARTALSNGQAAGAGMAAFLRP